MPRHGADVGVVSFAVVGNEDMAALLVVDAHCDRGRACAGDLTAISGRERMRLAGGDGPCLNERIERGKMRQIGSGKVWCGGIGSTRLLQPTSLMQLLVRDLESQNATTSAHDGTSAYS
jgi:hypothetical protein